MFTQPRPVDIGTKCISMRQRYKLKYKNAVDWTAKHILLKTYKKATYILFYGF